MRDPRYWRRTDPEYGAFRAWVGNGFRGLYPSDGAARGSVWVQPYIRDGHPVAGHWRRAPPRGSDESPGSSGPPASGMPDDRPEPAIVEANRQRLLRRFVPRAPEGRGGGDSPPMGRGRHPQRLDSEGRDRVEELRADPDTRRERNIGGRVDQWSRPGGEAGLARDLERLGPAGPARRLDNGYLIYPLRDGRIATVRRSTDGRAGRGATNEPTLEIATPGANGRFVPTDKLRYP